MPRPVFKITDTEQTVIRPIMFSVARDLCDILSIGNGRVYPDIVIEGESQVLPTRDGTVDEELRDKFNKKSKVRLEVNIEPLLEDGKSQAPGRAHEPFLFADDSLGIFVRPVHTTKQITLTVEYRASTYREMRAWLNSMRVYAQAGRDMLHHTVKYYYLIPDMVKAVLYRSWELREAQAGYNEDFKTWFSAHATPSVTQVEHIVGSSPIPVIAETQIGVQGTFNFVAEPGKPDRNQDTGTYTTSFEYSFRIEHPDAMIIKYPLMIHNQLLPTAYITPTTHYDFGKLTSHGTLFQEAYFSLGGRILAPNGGNGLAIPTGDDWFLTPQQRPTGYYPVFRFLHQVDPADPTLIVNLRDIGSTFKFTDAILAFFERQSAALFKWYQTPILFMLFDGDVQYAGGGITVDANLDVRTVNPLSLRGIYHFQVLCLGELDRLPTVMHDDIRCHPELLADIISFLAETPSEIPAPMSNGCITESAYNDILADVIKTRRTGQRPMNGYSAGGYAKVMQTVNISSIIITKKSLP